MKAVGVDLGSRRVGIAVSDSAGIVATPYGVIERSGDGERDRRAIAAVVAEVGAEVVVVGLPISLSGGTGPAAEAATAEAAALAEVLEVPVETFDERLTTVEAARRRRERAGTARSREGQPGRRERRRPARPGPAIDAEAAAVMLEAWLAGAAGREQQG